MTIPPDIMTTARRLVDACDALYRPIDFGDGELPESVRRIRDRYDELKHGAGFTSAARAARAEEIARAILAERRVADGYRDIAARKSNQYIAECKAAGRLREGLGRIVEGIVNNRLCFADIEAIATEAASAGTTLQASVSKTFSPKHTDLGTAPSPAINALRALRTFVGMVVDEIGIDADDTHIAFSATGPAGERELARVTLTQVLHQADAALSEVTS